MKFIKYNSLEEGVISTKSFGWQFLALFQYVIYQQAELSVVRLSCDFATLKNTIFYSFIPNKPGTLKVLIEGNWPLIKVLKRGKNSDAHSDSTTK